VVLESGNVRRDYVHGWGELINGGNCELAKSRNGIEGDDEASKNHHITWGLQVHICEEKKQYVTLERDPFRLFGRARGESRGPFKNGFEFTWVDSPGLAM
jgi:hypothetical protein